MKSIQYPKSVLAYKTQRYDQFTFWTAVIKCGRDRNILTKFIVCPNLLKACEDKIKKVHCNKKVANMLKITCLVLLSGINIAICT